MAAFIELRDVVKHFPVARSLGEIARGERPVVRALDGVSFTIERGDRVALVGVNEELGRTITPYTLPPDSPNLRMLMATVNDRQRQAYLEPYVRGETVSAIAVSEPNATATTGC